MTLTARKFKVNNLLSIVGAVALGAVGMSWFGSKGNDAPPPQPPLMSLHDMGHLSTVKVNYANIIEYDQKITKDIPWTQWELRLGGTKVLFVARGDCLVGTDLRLAKYENKNEVARTATLTLKIPAPLSARVNHDAREKGGSYFYAVNGTGIEPLMPSSSNRTKAIDSALARAQQEIQMICTEPEVIATAKKNAEALLRSAFSANGWKVQFQWQV